MDPSQPPVGPSAMIPSAAISPTPSAVPSDIAFIMQMVQGDAAQLQPSTATESFVMAPGEGVGETATDSEASDSSSDDEDSDDDDEESSSEAEEEPNTNRQAGDSRPKEPINVSLPSSASEPLTAERHATLLSQLTSFMTGSDSLLDGDGVGYITEDSDEDIEDDDEEEENLTDADVDELMDHTEGRFEEISDDEGFDGPLVTAHEITEEPVKPPPIRRLPKGTEVILAGEVMTYIPDEAALRMQEEADREEQVGSNAGVVKFQDLQVEELTQDKAEEATAMKMEEATEIKGETSNPAEEASATVGMGDVNMEDTEEGEVPEVAKSSTVETSSVITEIAEVLPPVNEAPTLMQEGDDVGEEDLVDLEAGIASSFSDDEESKTAALDQSNAPSTTTPVKGNGNGKGKGKGKGKGNAKPKEQRISSGGNVVIRALRPPQGFRIGDRRVGDDEGWLEEGSLICFKDGTVVATIAETFGPLTSPFYLLRLPPPPFPIPSRSSLTPGTQLYYSSSANRSYVPVRLLRTDRRFKGSDASNLYDEEVGDEEREWSDDEEEMLARSERKALKQGRDPASGGVRSGASRPSRQPHFDYQNEATVDSGLDYDGLGLSKPVSLPPRPNTGETSRPRGHGDRGGRGGERGARGGRGGGDRGARGGRGGRGGSEGGSRGRGQGRPDRGGAVGRGFGRQADGRGRGGGMPPRSGGVPYLPPVNKPSETTINMAAERAAREAAPRAPLPSAPLPAKPAGPLPPAAPNALVNPGQTGYNPAYQFHNAMQVPFQPWQQSQPGFMGGMVAPGAQLYGGLPQQMGAMNPYYQQQQQQQAMSYIPPYGYPAFPQQSNAGGAINPRFMGAQGAPSQYPAAGPPQYPAFPQGGMPPQTQNGQR